MEKDKIFFGESGLTSTSANYIANMAKEMYQNAESQLDSMVFYTTKVKLLGTSEEDLIRQGITNTKTMPDVMKGIAECKALIAWLREAIKAKERLLAEANASSYEDYNIEVPNTPTRESYITEDYVISQWNIKRRNRYYYLEALCVTIGQYIHPGGVYANEREQLSKIIISPNDVQGNGRDTLIYSRTPSVPQEEVEDTFMSLQNTYREYQAELNSMKHEVFETLNQDKMKKDAEYAQKMKDYKNEMASIDAELLAKKREAVTAISNYKIIIPDSLKSTYEQIQALGKK